MRAARLPGTTSGLLLLLVIGCARGPSTVEARSASDVLAELERRGHRVDAALGGGRVRYLGFTVQPEGALPGDQVRLTHYWLSVAPLDRPYRVFVHALVQGAFGLIPHGDHDPVPSPDRWPIGKVIRDEHPLALPEELPGDRVELRVGLYAGDARLPVDDPRAHDGTHRLLAGSFAVAGTPVPLPSYRAVRLATPPRLDGALEAAEWGQSAWTAPYVPSQGQKAARLTTRARLAWDPEHLYVALEAEDPDLQGSFTERDEPIYREEALELFIDADCDRRDYVELQASPRGTLFDARFTGPRQGMDTAYQADLRVGTRLDGTLDDASDRDRGWTAEWAVRAASVPGVPTPLAGGTRLCINLFRVGKDRHPGGVSHEETAWSPPLMGDFHNLERFGELWLVDAQE